MGFFKSISQNIKAARDRDPAARSSVEILLCYPGVWALAWHRPAHWLYTHGAKLFARVISQATRFWTGIEIHPGAVVGNRCFIDHGMAVVIGETSEIGDDVTIYQGVTLGGTGKETGKRHPTIGDRVMISTGAKVLGPFRVGEDSKIGAGSVVLDEVPPGSTVVGVPGRVVKRVTCAGEELNQIDLPDPVSAEIASLRERICLLEEMMKASGISEGEHKGEGKDKDEAQDESEGE